MRRNLAILIVTLMALVSTGCCATTPDVTEVNDVWKSLFDSFRRPTAAETEEYEALDDAGKEEWLMEGKPTNEPLEQDELDVINQMYEANKALGKAHEGETDEPADEPADEEPADADPEPAPVEETVEEDVAGE